MISPKDKYYLCQLILKFKDQTITGQELELLNKAFQQHPESIELLTQIIEVHTQLYQSGDSVLIKENNEILSDKFWQVLAEEEKKAPIIEMPSVPKESKTDDKTTEIQNARPRINKFSLYSLLLSTAALIFMIVYARYVPPKSGYEVATLTDSLRAKWGNPANTVKNGARLLTNQGWAILKEGIIQIRYDDGVQVVIEAPAEYELLTPTEIAVNYGRLYTTVSDAGRGFTVKTQNTRIIDLGTEFGVEADAHGDTYLHVMKGKTMLIAGNRSNKVSVEVGKGLAKKISFASQTISDISCNARLFARNINSQSKLVWRGQTEINLADIVGGGNGFGGGVLNTGIDVATGKMVSQLGDQRLFTGSTGYQIADGSPYIDGVFFPGINDGKTRITSDKSIAVQFPKTSGIYWGYIFNGAFHKGNDVPEHALQMNGVVFGKPDTPAITIHSSQGITFDLSKIRTNIPESRITQFRSLIGISETVQAHLAGLRATAQTTPAEMERLLKATYSNAVFWVFLDGKKVYEGKMANSDKPIQLEIPITDGDRFLTLAVTESDDGWAYDWALFGRPKLITESTP
jgi:hypothetical protein